MTFASLRVRVCQAIVIALCLSSCSDDEYGQKLYDFVRLKGRAISVEHAKAELEKRWAGAHSMGMLDLVALAEVLQARIDAVPVPDEAGSEELEALKDEHRGKVTTLNDLTALEADVMLMDSSLERWKGACDSRTAFEGSELRNAGRSLSLPPINLAASWEVVLSTDPAQYFNMVMQNRGASHIEEQNRIAKAALERFQRENIQGNELFELSRKICKGSRAGHDELASRVSETVTSMRKAIAAARKAYQSTLARLEARLIPRMIRDNGPAIRAEMALEEDRARARLAIRLGAARERLREVMRKPKGLARMKALEDLASEIQAEMKALPSPNLRNLPEAIALGEVRDKTLTFLEHGN